MSSLAPVLMFAQRHRLGGPAAQHHGDPVLQLWPRQQVAVLGGHLHGVAQRAPAARHDADLGNRIGVRHQLGHQRVPGLVVGDGRALLLVHDLRPALQPGHHPLDGRLEVLEAYGVGVAARGQQGRLVHHVGQVGAR